MTDEQAARPQLTLLDMIEQAQTTREADMAALTREAGVRSGIDYFVLGYLMSAVPGAMWAEAVAAARRAFTLELDRRR